MIEIILIVLVILIVLGLLWFVSVYNSLVSVSKQVDNSWAQIDVQLKRRADLIPNLIETVKGYAKFEKSTLTAITQARTALMNARGPKDAAVAENQLEGALKSIFAVAESYPTLKANENFKQLQEELSSTENKVAFARQFYNDMVMKWNTMIELFPTNIAANMLGKNKSREFFQIVDEERKNVKVDFSSL